MSNVWATMPYVQLSHNMLLNCIDNRQNQLFSEMSLRDVMELPIDILFKSCNNTFCKSSFHNFLPIIKFSSKADLSSLMCCERVNTVGCNRFPFAPTICSPLPPPPFSSMGKLVYTRVLPKTVDKIVKKNGQQRVPLVGGALCKMNCYFAFSHVEQVEG